MPDPYAIITKVDEGMQKRLADVLELRAAEPQQRAMAERYLSEINLGKGAKVLEVGCGTGAVSRYMAQLFNGSEVTGVDPSPVFVERARELAQGHTGLSFRQGDGRNLEFEDESFDLVVFHTTLCHIPQPEQAIHEAYRVLRRNGWLAIFDGDYPTVTVAIEASDPLQSTAEAMMENFVQNLWLTRRLPKQLGVTGFTVSSMQSHGYTQTAEPSYMLTIVDRGADLLAAAGRVSSEQADELKQEARRRIESREFFGHISFLSIIAQKPT